MNKPNILEEAAEHVYGIKQQQYGDARQDMERVAEMWSAILGHPIKADQVPLCMIAVKLSRLFNTPHHRDSIVDIAGWAAVLERVIYDQ